MRPITSLIYCSAALLAFAFLSYSAALTKCATYDEPLHLLASYNALYDGDFRVNPEHPPLWKYLAGLPLLLDPPAGVDPRSHVYRAIPDYLELQWPWCETVLYRTPGNDPDRLLARCRFVMLLCSLTLGVVIARFAHRVAGPVAACVAITLFCLDPNFLAHGSLLTNDVPVTLCTTSLLYALFLAGVRLTLPRAGAVCVLCAACITTKFTGLLAGPITALLLSARALLPAPWPMTVTSGNSSPLLPDTRRRRVLAVMLLCGASAVVTYTSIWAVYRFRFNLSPDPQSHFNTQTILAAEAKGDVAATAARERRATRPGELDAWRPGPFTRTCLFALNHHLLPESFCQGILYAHASSRFRFAYLGGQTYGGSSWAYFPVAVAVKSPLTTLASVAACIPAAFYLCRARRRLLAPPDDRAWQWLALTIPSIVFAVTALTSALNLGLRHVFPLYPPLYVGVGVIAARLHARRPRLVARTLAILLFTLLLETFSAYPDYIPFFNAAAGGSRGGFRLLGDSNLDWGQDLPLLADWQRTHPHRTLHLAYFGTADPAHYNIRYRNLPQGYSLGPPAPTTLPTTGVVAVSATLLQGLYAPRLDDPTYAPLRTRQPTEILGGSIYLFDLGGD